VTFQLDSVSRFFAATSVRSLSFAFDDREVTTGSDPDEVDRADPGNPELVDHCERLSTRNERGREFHEVL
jgi:hypothetical protein